MRNHLPFDPISRSISRELGSREPLRSTTENTSIMFFLKDGGMEVVGGSDAT
jgi:hypothetical protein